MRTNLPTQTRYQNHRMIYSSISKYRNTLPSSIYLPLEVKKHALHGIESKHSSFSLPWFHSNCNMRHRWVMLYNANLDCSGSNRQSLRQLKQELAKWEDSQQRRTQNVTDVVAYQVRLKWHHSEAFWSLTFSALHRSSKNLSSNGSRRRHGGELRTRGQAPPYQLR